MKKSQSPDATTASPKSGQPEINIGLIGHVDHGKTTLTERLSGKWTDTHSEELKRGITIKLGYADVNINKCGCGKLTVKEVCPYCGKKTKLQRIISLVDAPGHESLMATMMAGSAIMDGALLLVAANEPCPQPQTREHVMALSIIGLKNVIVVQNKVDLVSKEEATENYNQIKKFLSNTQYTECPIIPMSALHAANMDVLLEQIQTLVPTPKRDSKLSPLMFVARSFDINRPGLDPQDMVGGILGGSIKQGEISVGDEIEIKPGQSVQAHNQTKYLPIRTTVISLVTGGSEVKKAGPGGSIAIRTTLDPSVVAADRLAGSVLGKPNKLPPVRNSITFTSHLLKRVVGAKDKLVVENIKVGEILMINAYTTTTAGAVSSISKNITSVNLKLPLVIEEGERIIISRRVGNRWRLIGYGVIGGD